MPRSGSGLVPHNGPLEGQASCTCEGCSLSKYRQHHDALAAFVPVAYLKMFSEVSFYLASWCSTSQLEQNFSYLQLYIGDRKSRTTAKHIMRVSQYCLPHGCGVYEATWVFMVSCVQVHDEG